MTRAIDILAAQSPLSAPHAQDAILTAGVFFCTLGNSRTQRGDCHTQVIARGG